MKGQAPPGKRLYTIDNNNNNENQFNTRKRFLKGLNIYTVIGKNVLFVKVMSSKINNYLVLLLKYPVIELI